MSAADGIPAQHDQETDPHVHSAPGPLTEDDLAQLQQRMAILDGSDVVLELVYDVIEQSLLEADATYVERRLLRYTSREVATQLFLLVAACTPSLEPSQPALHSADLPAIRSLEDPPQCTIDAFCRNEIDVKSPPPPTPARPSTPQKTKRLTVTTSLVASVLLSSSASPASSPRSSGSKSGASLKPVKHEPGVPYSVGPPEPAAPTVSPRKTVALLKAAIRVSTPRPASPFPEGSTDAEGDECAEEETDPLPPKSPTPSPRKRSINATSPSSGWSIILPGDPTRLTEDEADISTSVSVEYMLPRRQSTTIGLPELPSARLSTSAAHKQSGFLPRAEESDAVEVDPMGMLGYELRTRLSLSAGVRMQSEGGDVVQNGPDLPVFATKMRRSTFMDESLAHELVSLMIAHSPSPSRPPQRPSTTLGIARNASQSSSLDKSCSSNQSSGVFSLTECPTNGLAKTIYPSMRSLATSNVSTTSTTTSLKQNLFRKPSKVARPCTASSQCCNGSGRGACATENSNEAYADLIKQRAFQRKPSVVNASPPKKSQTRRSIVSPTTKAVSSAPSPLSRRNLLTKTPSSSSSNHTPDDPLHHAAKIL